MAAAGKMSRAERIYRGVLPPRWTRSPLRLLCSLGGFEERAVLAVAGLFELVGGNEAERRGVDAVAQARRRGAVVEDVAQVRVGVGRAHLHAAHAVRGVGELGDVGGFERPHEARPARAGLELVGRGEQGLPGNYIDVDPGLVMIPEFVGNGGSVALQRLTSYCTRESFVRSSASVGI